MTPSHTCEQFTFVGIRADVFVFRMKSVRKKRVHDQSLDCTEENLVIRSLSLRLSEAMEARARQRAERRKEIEELKRKKEEEKLVSWKVIFWGNVGVFLQQQQLWFKWWLWFPMGWWFDSLPLIVCNWSQERREDGSVCVNRWMRNR